MSLDTTDLNKKLEEDILENLALTFMCKRIQTN